MSRAAVESAARLIAPFVHRTPVLTCAGIDELAGASVFFKCENFQRTGAFKARGAIHAVLRLPDDVDTVITHSSGNHGAALAWAARTSGKRALVIVPVDARPEKREAIEAYGGSIIDCGPSLADRESKLAEILEGTQAHFVPPYDHPDIVAGQGTAALELLEEHPDLDQIWVPVGGGGLAAGTVVASDGRAEVIAAEPLLARDAFDSMQKGERQPALPPTTLADGLRTALGVLNFDILHSHHTRVVLADEDSIMRATELVWTRMKIVIEPSAAVPLAALLGNPDLVGGRIGVIFSGGNVRP